LPTLGQTSMYHRFANLSVPRHLRQRRTVNANLPRVSIWKLYVRFTSLRSL
jgi:hypothetical protein